MTAVIVIIKPDAAHVLTDGVAQYPGPPVLTVPAHKAHIFPAHRAIFVARGMQTLGNIMARSMDGTGDLDAMADALPEHARAAQTQVEQFPGFGQHWDMDGPQHPAYEVISPLAVATPMTPIELTPDLDPYTDGLAIMRAQREAEPTIGGFCQLTSVYRDRIETRVLERWS